ncbi:MAG TPA: hypothetical protein VGK90_04575 [Rhizomicrobium sp.]
MKRLELGAPPKNRTLGLISASLPGMLFLSMTVAAQGAPLSKTTGARLHEAWRTSIISTAVPGKGCFTASYPSKVWKQVACGKAPARPFLPARGPSTFVVGNGNDYSAQTATPISSATASFPSIKGMTSETNDGSSDTYSLQLNSSYYVSPVCQGAKIPSECRAWMQFAYSNSGGGFMEVWLIAYGNNCPPGWGPYANDCYLNSNQVNVPTQTLAQLSDIKVTGTAVSGGNDTLKITTSSKAYSVTLPDSTVDLAGNWNVSEYNIFGDGGGSEAVFNPGTTIKVNIQMKDGSTSAPICITDGFTLESNNLGLNRCKAKGGKKPSISFTESN